VYKARLGRQADLVSPTLGIRQQPPQAASGHELASLSLFFPPYHLLLGYEEYRQYTSSMADKVLDRLSVAEISCTWIIGITSTACYPGTHRIQSLTATTTWGPQRRPRHSLLAERITSGTQSLWISSELLHILESYHSFPITNYERGQFRR
jgi:hypothetical protein